MHIKKTVPLICLIRFYLFGSTNSITIEDDHDVKTFLVAEGNLFSE